MMENCENACCKPATGTVQASPTMTRAAESLAYLLTDLPEFQNYLRASRTVHADVEVNKILAAMNGYGEYEDVEPGAYQDLNRRLEALPAMQAYRQAEQNARDIFAVVEQAISEAVGVSFAEHARPSACG